jgi:hypothetical protein
MSGQRSNLSLRRVAPLAAVLATIGPGAAQAASLSPDVPPPGPSLTPDPVPAVHRPPPVKRPAAVAPRRFVAVAQAPRSHATVARSPAVLAPVVRRRPSPPRKEPLVRVVDVFPLRVDVHRGLGALANGVRDRTRLAFAAAALLAAVSAAASGAALAAVARRPA